MIQHAVERFCSGYRRVAENRLAACLLAGLFPVLARVILIFWLPAPTADVQDEYSYLLGADTFAHGRLTNPTPPFWEHFESFHVIMKPTYASKYPPAQSMVLAIGQNLGHPWIGVLLSVGVMCGIICWMMQGWLRPSFALAGALLVAVRLGIVSYWCNSYWGGAVAAAGGSLVIGALARLVDAKRRNARHAIAYAAGLVILANSRPYEGLCAGVAASVVLLVVILRDSGPGVLFRQVIAPMAPVLLIAGLWMGYYNYRVTGIWSRLPYQVHEEQYGIAPSLIWLSPNEIPAYRHKEFRRHWIEYDLREYQRARKNPADNFLVTLLVTAWFFVGSRLLASVFVGMPSLARDRTDRLTLPIFVLFVIGVAPIKAVLPHYVAPICGLGYLRWMNSCQWLWNWRVFGLRAGAFAAVVLCGFVLVQSPFEPTLRATAGASYGSKRLLIQRELEAIPGRHLVVVEYGPRHSFHQDWIHNSANIEDSRIAWARSINPKRDDQLADHFRDRKIWRLYVDDDAPRLEPRLSEDRQDR